MSDQKNRNPYTLWHNPNFYGFIFFPYIMDLKENLFMPQSETFFFSPIKVILPSFMHLNRYFLLDSFLVGLYFWAQITNRFWFSPPFSWIWKWTAVSQYLSKVLIRYWGLYFLILTSWEAHKMKANVVKNTRKWTFTFLTIGAVVKCELNKCHE